jgi:nucleoside-diphosphate-sugar epimerase
MAPGKVTVFGGTGFLGQRVVQRLLERDLPVRGLTAPIAYVSSAVPPVTRLTTSAIRMIAP